MKIVRRMMGLMLCALCLLALPALAEGTANFADLAVMDGRLLALNRHGIQIEQDGAWIEACPVSEGQLMTVSGETLYVLCGEGVVRFRWQEETLERQDVLIDHDTLPDSFFYDMAAEGDTVWLLGLPNTDIPYNRRSVYVIENGASRQLAEGDYINLALTDDGVLLTLARGDGATALTAISRDTGRERALATLNEPVDQGQLTGLTTDGGYAWAMGQARLYRMNLSTGAAEIAAYVLRDESRASRSAAAAVSGGAYYFLHSEQGLMSGGTDPAALEGRPLRVSQYSMGWNEQTLKAFAKLHRETAVEQKVPLYGNGMSDIVQAMINQDGGIDVYWMAMQSTGYVAVRDKGYCLPLNGSEVLMDYVDGMYPAFGDLLWRGDSLCAVPVSFETSGVVYDPALLEEAGLTADDLPGTIMELMDFIAAWDDDRPVKLLEASAAILRRQLFYLIRDTQEAWCAAHGVSMTWDAPEVLALLRKLDEITPSLERFAPADSSMRNWGPTLLNLMGNFAPSAYLLSDQGQMPLPLSRAEGEDYYVSAYVDLLSVNPYSASPEEAVDLLECAVRYGEYYDLLMMLLHPDENDPVEDPRYRMEMDLIAEESARYTAMLEDESLSVNERDNARYVLALYDTREEQAEAFHWAISAEGIARWREIVPHVYVLPTPGDDVLLNVRDRYIGGQLTAEQFVREAESIMWMIQMEQE